MITLPVIYSLFRMNAIPWRENWRIYGLPVIQKHRQSVMRFGPSLQLRSAVHSNPLGINHPVFLCTWQAGAILEVGAQFGMTGGSLCAAQKIIIGDRVIIGANSTIIDTDFHPLQGDNRRTHPQEAATAPVIIEDDVFIGMNCLILKGITLGKGCVVGAGSVVTRDVPPEMIVGGNPAKVIGKVYP
jgi:acetyltransferase-like isoleucine patch superfamily enzyme